MRHTLFIVLLFHLLSFAIRAQDTLSFHTTEEGFDLMRQLAIQGDYPGAKRIGNQLLGIDQDNHDVFLFLARIHAWQSDYDTAAVMVNSILKENPEHPDALTLKADIDYWCAVLEKISEEAYNNPELVKSAPQNSSIHKFDWDGFNDPDKWAMSWRAYKRKQL